MEGAQLPAILESPWLLFPDPGPARRVPVAAVIATAEEQATAETPCLVAADPAAERGVPVAAVVATGEEPALWEAPCLVAADPAAEHRVPGAEAMGRAKHESILESACLVSPGAGQRYVDGDKPCESNVAGSFSCSSMCSGHLGSFFRNNGDARVRLCEPVRFNGFDELDLNSLPPSDWDATKELTSIKLADRMNSVEHRTASSSESGLVLPASSSVFNLNVEPSKEATQSNGIFVGDIVPLSDSVVLQAPVATAMAGRAAAEGNATAAVQAVAISGNNDAVVPCGWKRRNFAGKGPDRREKTYVKPSALEQALMKFADRSTDYIISPDIGTEFDNCDEAYEYYNLYSWEIGFGIRIGKTRYSDNKENRKLKTEERYQLGQEFLCSCAGRPIANLKSTSSRTNCPAKLRLARTSDNGWIVVEHVAVHNHVMTTTYGENKHWPSHSRLDKYTKDLVRMLRQNNIGITKLYSILGTFFGKMENVPTTKRCLKTLCQKINREQADDDIKKTLSLFARFFKDDPGFKYAVDPDEDGRIKTLMWTNSRSIMQYEHFGDAITFDTTYKTNLYEMPFGLFVGVNNHFQSVLLGGVLMTDETIESFEWVFRNFASLMGGKEPATILTDQCRAMEVAIGNVWKNTTHRWCKWHVLKRIAECLGQKYTCNREFRDKFHKILNELMGEEEFDGAWNALLDEYGLQDNAFLKQVFATRKMWVKSYFRDVFCARMTSTQRSESANMMLKNIVPPSCPLNVFVEQYSKLQYIRDEEESYQEKRSKMEKKQKSTGGPIIEHATELYTPNVLSLLLELKDDSEFYKAIPLSAGKQYMAEHYNLGRVQRWCKGRYMVTIHGNGPKYRCECGLFEHFGLPCCHILRVMVATCEQQIPDSMIMKRWTKKARVDLPAHMEVYNRRDPNMLSQSYRHSSLMISALEYVEMGDRNPECCIIGLRFLADGKKAMAGAAAESDGLGLADRHQGDVEEAVLAGFDEFPQRAPKRRRERGRPTNRRDKPGYEGGSKRPRFCSVCQSDKHDKRRCPEREHLQVLQRRGPTCSGCGLVGHTVAGCTLGKQQLVAIRNMLV